MRHRKKRLQLNRFSSWHKATLRSMARNLLLQQSMRTTLTKAKALRPLAEKLVLLAKQDTLAARRYAFKILGDHKVVSLLFKEIGPRFTKRVSGFTRIINLGVRRGDDAKVVIMELTEIKRKEVKKPKKKMEAAAHQEHVSEAAGDKPVQEKKTETKTAVQERPPVTKRPAKKFLGGLKNIFKKERDSL
ncbi:MAG: 50S ribosomal protein L17 [Candidatus Omnitrophica bacterium]|nr:50S ribosomal protein L17 [Candidatus Omnitrophota bacterium]